MVYAFYYCKKNGEGPEKKMVVVGALHERGLFRVLKDSAFALLSPVIILGCIYTESLLRQRQRSFPCSMHC